MSHHSGILPSEASPRAHRLALILARPVEKFLQVEASSGINLLVVFFFVVGLLTVAKVVSA